MCVYACVILTWWPVRWRRAAFPTGLVGSPRSSSGVGASRHRSCHSSGTCRRKGRLSAPEWWRAGRLLHKPGSLSRSRWPGVSEGEEWNEEWGTIYLRDIIQKGDEHWMRWRKKRRIRGGKWKREMKQWEGEMGWGLQTELDQERWADELGSEGEKKG